MRGLDLVWESAPPPPHIWERYPKKKRFFFGSFPYLKVEQGRCLAPPATTLPPHLPTSPPTTTTCHGRRLQSMEVGGGERQIRKWHFVSQIFSNRHSVSSLLLKVKHLLPLTIEHEVFINFLEFENLMPRDWTYQ